MEISNFRAFQSNNVILRHVKNSPILRNSLILVEMVVLKRGVRKDVSCFAMIHMVSLASTTCNIFALFL